MSIQDEIVGTETPSPGPSVSSDRDQPPRVPRPRRTPPARASRPLRYAVVPRGTDAATFTPDPYLVATSLAPDAVVACHAALQYRGRTYSVWNRFHIATRAKTTTFTFRGSTFLPVRPPARTGAGSDGVVEEHHAGGTVRTTTFERTLVDLVDAPDVGGGWEEV
jgi:predicted transcriptional regulator of viral defense system